MYRDDIGAPIGTGYGGRIEMDIIHSLGDRTE